MANERLMRATLTGRTTAEMEEWTTRWLTNDFPGQLQAWTLERLTFHQQAGHCCVMVSASPDIYLKRLAQHAWYRGQPWKDASAQG